MCMLSRDTVVCVCLHLVPGSVKSSPSVGKKPFIIWCVGVCMGVCVCGWVWGGVCAATELGGGVGLHEHLLFPTL